MRLGSQASLALALLAAALTACSDDDGTGPSRRVRAGLRLLPLGWAVDLTPDGRVAALQDPLSATGNLYLYDVRTGVLEYKTQVGSPLRDFATGLSANGVVSAHYSDPVQAGIWTDRSEWTSPASASATSSAASCTPTPRCGSSRSSTTGT